MANRLFSTISFHLEKNVVDLYLDVTFGGTGAPTMVAANSKGFKSVTRTSAGLFVATLGNSVGVDKYNKLLFAGATFVLASGIPAAMLMHVVSFTGSVLTFQLEDADTPAATDPASGEEMLMHVVLSNSKAS